MVTIYHITSVKSWDEAIQSGSYIHPSLAAEGFIHCAEEGQVAGVLERYFKGQTSLVKLKIDTSLLTSPLQYDFSPSTGESFPHIYGPVNCSAVVQVIPLQQ